MLLPHIQSSNEKNPEKIHNSDTLDMIEKDLSTSYENFDFGHNVFDDDPFCHAYDNQPFLNYINKQT